MVNCPGKFIPNLTEVTAPLQTVLTKVVVFNLQNPQLNAIETLKNLITSAFVLKMIDPNLSLRLKIEVKSAGLEALFEKNQGSLGSQKLHPIGYSSRLAHFIVLGVKRFHECLHDRKSVIINDHQSLTSIFTRYIVICPLRIQSSRMTPVKKC